MESSFEETPDDTYTRTSGEGSIETDTKSESALEKLTRTSQLESSTTRFSKSDPSSIALSLSPWEKWIVDKASKRRKEIVAKAMVHNIKEMEDLKLANDKLRKHQLCDQRYKAWVASKNVERNRQKIQQELNAESKRKLAEAKVADTHEKSLREYNRWVKIKLKDERGKKALLKEKEKVDASRRDEKRALNEAEYLKWQQKAANIPSIEYRCYGYTSGKIISWKC